MKNNQKQNKKDHISFVAGGEKYRNPDECYHKIIKSCGNRADTGIP